MKIVRFIICLMVVLLTSCGLELEEIEYDPIAFDKLSFMILDNPEIFQMDDFSRHSKFINNVPIRLSEEIDDSSKCFLSQVEDSLRLDPKIVNALRVQLEMTKLREYFRVGDTILFTVDGMLDTSWGFLHSSDDLKMDSSWFDFHGYTLLYTKDINRHWKKVVIK